MQKRHIGELIRARRLVRGLTQRELARAVGSDQGTISRGEQSPAGPKLATLGRICAALGTTVTKLTGY